MLGRSPDESSETPHREKATVLFKRRFHDGLRRGAIDRTYRTWARPKVKVGGTYRFTASDVLRVTHVEAVQVGHIDAAAAQAAGFESVDELRRTLEQTARRRLAPRDEVWCVRFAHEKGAADATPSSFDPQDVDVMVQRVEAMETRSRSGPWAWATLRLIRSNPQRRAGDLAPRIGSELQAFKTRVRRLKKLGLTRSFEIGYELTPLGEAVLELRESAP